MFYGSPISKIPPDVLQPVLILSSSPPTDSLDCSAWEAYFIRVMKLIRVCPKWRATLMSSSTSFATIAVGNKSSFPVEALETWLQLAGQCSLTIRVGAIDNLRPCLRMSSRIKSLSLFVQSDGFNGPCSDVLATLSAFASLQHFNLKVRGQGRCRS